MSNPTSQQIKSITPPSIEEREVQTLEAIADSQYLTEGWPMLGTPHDARSIIQLLMRHSLAIRDPESPRVKQFVNRYYEVSTWNIQTVNFIRLHYELQQFFGRLDELFFFGLLTRSVARPSSGRKNLLELGIFDTVSAEGCYGLCSNQRWAIEVWVRDPQNPYRRLPFDQILLTILHESVHAYFKFADNRHPDYFRIVKSFGGHGEGFQILLPFIANVILNLTNSEEWRKGLTEISAHLFRITGTSIFPSSLQGQL